ncbi:hypothetical protein M9458_041673, partial [Cirrhinus mrigala]
SSAPSCKFVLLLLVRPGFRGLLSALARINESQFLGFVSATAVAASAGPLLPSLPGYWTIVHGLSAEAFHVFPCTLTVYNGDPNACQAFLSQYSLVFSLQPRRYATEEAKRRSSVTEYAIQFQTLAAVCGWNEGALRTRFLEGLDHAIADELAALDIPRKLDNVINLALRVEGRLNHRRLRRQPTAPWRHLEAPPLDATNSASAEAEPMQLGRLRLMPQQKQERLIQGLCFYCGKTGHFILQCPLQAKAH